jgi:tRNA (guanosine-2'-O-)-methyltransferase
VQRDSKGIIPASDISTPQLPWDARRWSPEQVIELLEPLVGEPRRARLRTVLSQRLESVVVMMDAPHDPHNAAAVLRSCDAFGIQELHVVPREEEFQAGAAVSKGTERWVDVVQHDSPAAAIAAMQQRQFQVVAAHPGGELLPEQLARVPRLALLLGNEHDGICSRLLDAATTTVRIPMRGFVESLNVSVSAGILLAAATAGRSGDLAPGALRLQYARGLFRSVVRAGEILDASSAPDPAAE